MAGASEEHGADQGDDHADQQCAAIQLERQHDRQIRRNLNLAEHRHASVGDAKADRAADNRNHALGDELPNAHARTSGADRQPQRKFTSRTGARLASNPATLAHATKSRPRKKGEHQEQRGNRRSAAILACSSVRTAMLWFLFVSGRRSRSLAITDSSVCACVGVTPRLRRPL